MSYRILLLSLISSFVFIPVISQKHSHVLFKSSALTPVNSFTDGIEGPAVAKTGIIYAVNYERQGTIGQVSPSGDATIFIELPGGSIGNGIRFDNHGNMLIADYTNHNILKVEMETKELSIFAHEPRMNQPNDIAIDSKNRIYASDPDWKARKGRIWRIEADGITTVLDTLGTTNGIEVSPDERTLYVNASRTVWAYDLSEAGNVNNRRVFIEFPDFELDGMRCDIKGNLYIAWYGKGLIAKVSPEGRLLKEIPLIGNNPTNVAFGGKNGRILYVTLEDQGNIESFLVDFPGREWKMQKKLKH